MEALQKFNESFIKKLHVYMFLKEHVDFLTKLCILSKCDWMNVFSTCDIIIVKQVWKCIEKVQKTSENS